METPIQELIKQLEDLRDSIPDEDAMYRGGVINAIRLAEGMLEKEEKFHLNLLIAYNEELNQHILDSQNILEESDVDEFLNNKNK